MVELIQEQIHVETAEQAPRPLRFTWRGETHEITHILAEHVDIGFGTLPLGSRSRTWFNRRHRRYFTVQDSSGDIFEIYLDYANRSNPTWWLAKRE